MYTHHRLKLKVRATMESHSQSPTTMPLKWTEIIEKLWDNLPHFQQWYDEDCLKFDCVKLQFDDGKVNNSDSEIWLDQNVCEKESSVTVEETKQQKISQSKLKFTNAHKWNHPRAYCAPP